MSHDYDNRAAVPEWADHFACWKAQSAALRDAWPDAVLDVHYAPHPRCRFDLFPAKTRRGTVLVFIHGGYWQWNAKEEFAFLAPAWLANGVDVVLLGYPLAPEVRLPDIIAGVRRGLARVVADCTEHLGGRQRIAVAGWSAGAHLALSVADIDGVNRVIGLSGIYDLVPLIDTPLNAVLGLDREGARTVNPVQRASPLPVPCLLGAGAAERPALRAQTVGAAAQLATLGSQPVLQQWAGLNHYSVLDSFGQADGIVYRDVSRFVW